LRKGTGSANPCAGQGRQPLPNYVLPATHSIGYYLSHKSPMLDLIIKDFEKKFERREKIMRLTRHNGRVGKAGVYNPKHNDRKFDVNNNEHIDAERSVRNIYWDCYRGFTSPLLHMGNEGDEFSFEQVEMTYYFEHYQDHIDAQNERNDKVRHSERNREAKDLLKNAKTCPEETIYQIGTMDEHISEEILVKITMEFFEEMQKRYGSHIHILDWALHLDEATPHIQERHVFDCENKYGELCPQQEKALEELGIPLPDPSKKRSSVNNRKITFDAQCRELLFSICKKYNLKLEEEPTYGGRKYLEKQDYIIQKQKAVLESQKKELSENSREIEKQNELITEKSEVLREKQEALEAVTMKLEDMESLVDEVAERAYEKACEVVDDTVREETKKADMETVTKYRDWLSSPERTADRKLLDFAVKHFNDLLKALKTGTEKLKKKIVEKLQEPEKKAENLEQVKAAAKTSLRDKMSMMQKEVDEYKAQNYGMNEQPKKRRDQAID